MGGGKAGIKAHLSLAGLEAWAELGNKICNIALLIDVKAITLTMGSQKKT